MKKISWVTELSKLLNSFESTYINPSSKICDTVTIREKVYIGKNVFIGDGTLIIGPCYIGDNSFIGAHNIIQRSYLAEDVNLGTRSYLSDSLIEKNVWISNIGTANTKLSKDFSNKAGVYIKEGTRLGIGVYTMPGVSIGKNSIIYPGAIIYDDVPDEVRVKVKQTLATIPYRHRRNITNRD